MECRKRGRESYCYPEFFEKQRQPIGYSRKGNVTIPNREEKVGPSTLLIPGSLHSAGAAPLGSASETFAANRIGRTALALAGFAQITAILTAGAATGALSALCF